MKLKQNTTTLNKAFPFINKALFNGELEKPIIKAINLIEMLGLTVIHFGYNDRDGFSGLTMNYTHGQFVAVCKNNPSNEDFINTFIHELVHVWQAQNNKPMNHGKAFKKKCNQAYDIFYLGHET